jgi:hypothetical protein
LQAVFKTKEGAGHPDRDAQFEHINALAGMFLDGGDPVISVDTKKKELVGEYANKGREWQPTGEPVEVNGHDFPSGVPKAIPYGVYDVGADDGFVTVGVDHDTAGFAVNAIRTWWDTVGRLRYPRSRRLLVTADCGGSNGSRLRAFKVELAAFAEQSGLEITVCHFPPGTSKWNKVEVRHEASPFRAGMKGPALVLSQQHKEAEGSRRPRTRTSVGAALTTTGRVSTVR